MSRKIIFIIIGALLFLALLALLWFWLLQRSPAADTGNQSGFGTSTDRGGTSGSAGRGGNTPGNTNATQGGDYTVTLSADGYILTSATGNNALPPGAYRITQGGRIVGTYDVGASGIGSYTLAPQGITGTGTLPNGAYTFVPITLGNTGIGAAINNGGGIDTGPQGTTTPNTTGTGGGTTTPATTTPQDGVTTGAWLGSNVSERIFSASDIADLTNPGSLGGTPLISTIPQPASVNTSGLVIGVTAAACLAQWLANQLSGAAVLADPVVVGEKVISVPVLDFSAAKQRTSQNVIQCIVKSIAQAAIDQITRSIVTWINSGFNGQPSFVTNFNQYFANVADQAAGEFIKSSALSFLCSPFAPQIKIAIAQSYANRNSASAGSCSLSKVTNNINGFLKGNWGAGGWGGLLQFTTMPANNPYGAYAYAQIGLNSQIARKQGEANRVLSPGGFISVQKCDNVPTVNYGSGSIQPQKNCKVTTPGQVVQDSLKTSLDSSVNQLQVAQNIDEIIKALVNQLILKSLYGGLANANTGVTNPLAPAVDQAASAQAQALLTSLRASATFAVQFGSAKQGSASDIQQVQNNFNNLFNCWETAATSTALNAGAQAQAKQSATSADAQIAQLEAQITALNADITRANASIAVIQDLQSQVLFAATPEDIQSATYAVQAATPTLITQADVTTAQQNRTALQTQLTATNQLAQSGLTQCRAALGI